MPRHGKKYREAVKLVEAERRYPIGEAAELLPKLSISKFDGTVEAHLRLGIDPRHADQAVRGTVVLPHGTGKSVRVVVFAQGEKAQEAQRAGADEVGAENLVKRVDEGWFDFDIERAVREIKSGRVEFKVDRTGIVHVPVGRASFSPDQLTANLGALVDAVQRAKPSGAKGTYMRSLTIAPTMGPGIRVDIPSALAAASA